jgi:hypothetical protein
LPKRKPLNIGDRSHRLEVIGHAEPEFSTDGIRHYRVEVRCDCGTTKIVREHTIKYATAISCGCFFLELDRKAIPTRSLTHGKSKTRTWAIWCRMRNRCFNSRSPDFYLYGGRGITVCSRWLEFENFLSDMGEAPAGLSIDRINHNGNYEPGNCRWATPMQQGQNKRNNKTVILDGQRITVSEACRRLMVSPSTLYQYKKYHGRSYQEAVDYYVKRQSLKKSV